MNPTVTLPASSGSDVAEAVRQEAARQRALWDPVATQQTLAGLLAFDRDLKERSLNPGTTADFVVATLFAAGVSGRLGRLGARNPLSSEGA